MNEIDYEFIGKELGIVFEEAKPFEITEESLRKQDLYLKWVQEMITKYGYWYPTKGPEQYPEPFPYSEEA